MCSNHAEISVVVAEDQEQVDKILSLQGRAAASELVVYDDPRGLRHYRRPVPRLVRGDPGSRPRLRRRAIPGYVEAEIDTGSPDDLALFSYTSGTTARPRA